MYWGGGAAASLITGAESSLRPRLVPFLPAQLARADIALRALRGPPAPGRKIDPQERKEIGSSNAHVDPVAFQALVSEVLGL